MGPKTQIRLSQCTRDLLCVDGECPAFVSVIPRAGAKRRRNSVELIEPPAAEPSVPKVDSTFTIFAVGRGGTGAVTISHVIAFAAMIEGKYVYLSNNTGLSQKGGPVESPIQISATKQVSFHRLLPGTADLYLGFDLARAAEGSNLKYAASDRTVAVVGSSLLPTADQNRHPDGSMPDAVFLRSVVERYTRSAENIYLDTYAAAELLFADSIFANMLLFGAAYQAGMLPLSATAIEQAIEINGRAVEDNLNAFRWGRVAVAEPDRFVRVAEEGDLSPITICVGGVEYSSKVARMSLQSDDEIEINRYRSALADYQNKNYADTFAEFVERIRVREKEVVPGSIRLTRTVARQLFRLMAYKDEYEVARLATAPEFERRVERLFDGDVHVVSHLQPPSLRWLFKHKVRFGPWIRPLLKLLSRLKWLRATRIDPFAFSRSRRQERALIVWYRDLVEKLLVGLSDANIEQAIEISDVADGIRGFEEVKSRAARVAMAAAASGYERYQKK